MRVRKFLGFLICFVGLGTAASAAEPVVLACNEFPPFKMEHSDTGLKGFDVEFLEEIFKRADISLKIVYMPWKRALREAQRGLVSGVCSCSKTEERNAFIDYSDPLGNASSGLFSLSKNNFPPIKSLEEIGSRRVSVILEYNLVDNLKSAGVKNILQVSSEIRGAKMLVYGHSEYFYGYKAPVQFYLNQLGHSGTTTYNELTNSDYYSCFSKNSEGSENLLKTFNAGLKAIKADGTYDDILAKYR